MMVAHRVLQLPGRLIGTLSEANNIRTSCVIHWGSVV